MMLHEKLGYLICIRLPKHFVCIVYLYVELPIYTNNNNFTLGSSTEEVNETVNNIDLKRVKTAGSFLDGCSVCHLLQ